MRSDEKTDGKPVEPFLARWARAKHEAKASVPPLPVSVPAMGTESQNTSIGAPSQHKVAGEARPEPTLPDAAAPVELPSLESMTPQSDFSPFMAPNVDPLLRNQAMKKLFTDPHYNIMDRLDIYIDDYSTHPPLPIEIIRQMSISKTLRLFDDEDEQGEEKAGAKGRASVPAATTTGDAAIAVPADARIAHPPPPAADASAPEREGTTLPQPSDRAGT